MSYKSSQLLPLMVTSGRKKSLFGRAFSRRHALAYRELAYRELGRREIDSWGIQPFHPWLAHNPDSANSTRRSVSWGKMLGLSLTVVTGATFWTGAGLLLAHLWK